MQIVRARSSSEACKGADIITTVTADKKNAVIITPPMVRAGQHVNAVGGDCPGKTELHADVLHMPGARVIVEYEPQSRIEGEIQQVEPDFPVIEFAALVSGKAVGRTSPADITIFDSVGFALEDYSALRFLHALLAGGSRQSPADRSRAATRRPEGPVRRHARRRRQARAAAADRLTPSWLRSA